MPVNQPTSNKLVQPHLTDPLGIFDSGVGGLSIFREIRRQLPAENILYIADQAHVPYGTRTLEEVRHFSDGITRFFLDNRVKLTVIACNAASAAALRFLRDKYPAHPFVGMEPAVKPAAQKTHTRRVGILATQATFQGALYASLLERFAQDVSVYENTCPGLVQQIEKGELDSQETRRILESAIHPMLLEGIDTIVLGCTHYPFVIPLIREIAGPGVVVIDPAPAIARQTERLLEDKLLLNPEHNRGQAILFSTANPIEMLPLLPRLIHEQIEVQPLTWQTNHQDMMHLARLPLL
jgi:glutamate racemase